MRQLSIPAVWMRGGTSKGLFVREEDLPPPGKQRDELILEVFGSPDPMQIDGVGGTHSTTSKLMAVSRSERHDCDIDYLFAQVAVDKPVVDYGGNCGNLTSAIAPYAMDEGLAEVEEPVTVLRLFNKNTGKKIVAHVPVDDGEAGVEGSHWISGVLRPGAKIVTQYLEPGGAVTGSALPTGAVRERVATASSNEVEVSIVDVTNPIVFVRANDLGLMGTELPDDLNRDSRLLARVEEIRAECALRLGLVNDPLTASTVSPGNPKLAFVSPPHAYEGVLGEKITAERVDIVGRIMSMQKVHHAYAISGAMCTAAAARLPGTIPNEVATATRDQSKPVRLGHPKGIAAVQVDVTSDGGVPRVASVTVTRTARRLMAGEVYYRAG